MELEDTRTKILSAALELFALKGYDSVGIQEICDDSGISKPTLYYHFQNKLGVLETILAIYGADLCGMLKSSSCYSHDMIKHLTSILVEHVKFAKENPKFFRLYSSLDYCAIENETYKAHLKLKKQVDDIYLQLFSNCSQEFGNMRGHEKLFSQTFQALVVSTTLLVLNEELEFTDENVYRIIRSFVYGVAN